MNPGSTGTEDRGAADQPHSSPPGLNSGPSAESSGCVVFSTLAGNQTDFYADVASELQGLGYQCQFLSFHEPSLEGLRKRGFPAVSVFEESSSLKAIEDIHLAEFCEKYQLDHPNRLISHEKLFYGLTDSRMLLGKLTRYLQGVDRILSSIKKNSPPDSKITLVQELGGFLSVIAGYFAARRLSIDNVFIEPSFFRGRLIFLRNTFDAMKPAGTEKLQVTPEVRTYLKETMEQKKIVIPIKDRGFYRKSVAKILSWHNAKRLVQKMMEKHVHGQREEFNHLGNHVFTHLRMARNEFFYFRRHYQELPLNARLVYFPLHVPADVALTIRAPEYVDQWALIDYLARSIPVTHTLIVKEHPATVGAASRSRVADLLTRHDNVRLLNPWINNYDVIRESEVVITINSKSGAEAILSGKPVIALGDSFYRNSALVRTVKSLSELPGALAEILREKGAQKDPAAVEQFFQQVWDLSHPGELYSNASEHASIFSKSLARFLQEGRS